MPKVKLAIFVSSIEHNTQTGNYSLIDVFTHISAAANPKGLGFILVVFWEGEIGETFSQSFTVLDRLGNVVIDSVAGPVTIGGNPHYTTNPFHRVIPAKQGAYTININVNGFSVDTVTLIVKS